MLCGCSGFLLISIITSATVTSRCIAVVTFLIGWSPRWPISVHSEISGLTVVTRSHLVTGSNVAKLVPNIHRWITVHIQFVTIWSVFWPVECVLKTSAKIPIRSNAKLINRHKCFALLIHISIDNVRVAFVVLLLLTPKNVLKLSIV